MVVKIRDRKHRYYKEKCVIRRIDYRRDEICLETLSHNQRKIYLKGIKKSERKLKRVVPCTIGSRVAIISENERPRIGHLRKFNKNGNLDVIFKKRNIETTFEKVCRVVWD